MEAIEFAFFVDFDGTIASIDVCEKMVTTFCKDGWQEINEKWERKELSTLECARQTFGLFKTHNPEEFYSLIENVSIDPGFQEFLTYCRKRNFPVVILSDGYDFYIEYLMKREEIEIPYYANKLVFAPGLDVEAPYGSSSCDQCGVCKLDLMNQLKKSAEKTVYIGDGYSDFCPAQIADMVFAKTVLYELCLQEGKSVHYFTDFRDIVKDLNSIIEEESF